jgi:hypothetical protein
LKQAEKAVQTEWAWVAWQIEKHEKRKKKAKSVHPTVYEELSQYIRQREMVSWR